MGKDETGGDAELLRRYRAGDGEALWELCRRVEPLLRRRVEQRIPRRLRRRVSVADILQEARLAAFERRDAFEERGPDAFRRWILGIVDNKALRAVRDHRGVAKRDQGREVTRGERVDTQFLSGQTPSPSQVYVASELAELAREAMKALPPDYREVLRLAREHELTLREVGERMGRSREATKKLYARAISRFEAELDRRRGGHDA